MDIQELADLYQQRLEEREQKQIDFFASTEPGFLIMQGPGTPVYNCCNEIRTIVDANLTGMANGLRNDWSDTIPYMEPWIGTGIYANAFGCEYFWREDESPHVEYRYHKIEELRDVDYPDWRESPVMRMVLDTIDALKEATDGKLPIGLTDTQSPYDTATLILDAAEFFTACYTEPEIVHRFMGLITDLIIEFSKVQAERIGDELWARPGHIMPGLRSLPGIAVSDDNLAVASPRINKEISMPYNARIGAAFDGIAVHSCGTYAHTMPALSRTEHVILIDFAASPSLDPNPNVPEEVRDGDIAPNVILKARLGGPLEQALEILPRVVNPKRKMILHLAYDEDRAEETYKRVYDAASKLWDGVEQH